jgi:DHA2 family multidrug resistance protein
VLGGYFIDNFSWPLIFFVNVPIGIAAFCMTLLYIRTPAYVKRDDTPIDVVALGLLAAGLGSLQYVLEQGQRLDWFSSDLIVTLTGISIVAIGAFVIRELRDAHPMVDLRVFASRAFSAGNVISVITGFGLYGAALILPLFLQVILGFTPTEAGLALVPGALATMLSLPLASRATRFADSRLLIALGLGIFAVGSWWMGSLNQDAGYWDVFWPRALQGFSIGFMFVPLSTATLAEVPNARMASATGLYTLVRQLGGSFGIAVLLFLQTRYQDTAYAGIASSVTLASPSIAYAVQHRVVNANQLFGMAMTNATIISYDMVFRLCAIVFALAIPFVFLLRPRMSR